MIVLIDGKNLLFRSHFAHPTLADTKGRPTSAIYGFIDSIRMLRKAFVGQRFIVCWEGGATIPREKERTSWRRDIFPAYKDNRKPGDAHKAALDQIPAIVNVLEVLGVTQVEVPGLEADDLISLIAHRTDKPVTIYSNDKDFVQIMLKKNVNWARASKDKYDIQTLEDIREEFGVHPRNWTKYRALSGDASDNIKVLVGIGPKKALQMLADGVDPSVPQFENLRRKPQRIYAKIADQWPALHAAYLISNLPTTVKELRTTIPQKRRVADILDRAVTNPERWPEPGIRAKDFLAICDDYELQYFSGMVGQFFPL